MDRDGNGCPGTAGVRAEGKDCPVSVFGGRPGRMDLADISLFLQVLQRSS
jgi:hypothetical protein